MAVTHADADATRMAELWSRRMGATKEGERNPTLNSALFVLSGYVKAGRLPRAVLDDVCRIAAGRGLGASEIDATRNSAWNSATAKPSRPFTPSRAAPTGTSIAIPKLAHTRRERDLRPNTPLAPKQAPESRARAAESGNTAPAGFADRTAHCDGLPVPLRRDYGSIAEWDDALSVWACQVRAESPSELVTRTCELCSGKAQMLALVSASIDVGAFICPACETEIGATP